MCRLTRSAFIAYWLSRFILPGSPGVVHTRHLSLAIRIATGYQYPLAPLYLGSQYKKLDLFHDCMVRSFGRFRVSSYIDLPFLQVFLWERFKGKYTPSPVSGPHCGMKDHYKRALLWKDRQSRGRWVELIDNKRSFTFRPYNKNIFYPEEQLVDLSLPAARHSLKGLELNFLWWSIPGWLPSLNETSTSIDIPAKQGVVAYCPNRVARQFGYDQGIPSILSQKPSYPECCNYFCSDLRLEFCSRFGKVYMPARGMEGYVAPEWVNYWKECMTSFKEYVREESLRTISPSQVFQRDPFLSLPLLPKADSKKRKQSEVYLFPFLFLFFVCVCVLFFLLVSVLFACQSAGILRAT